MNVNQHNIPFVLIASIALCAIIVNLTLLKFLPDYSLPKTSTLEARDYQAAPKLNLATLQSGEFQSQLEQYLADRMPQRDTALLANATWQRNLIGIADLPLGFGVHSTHYGTKYILDTTTNHVMSRPSSITSDLAKNLENIRIEYSDLISQHPNTRWSFYLIPTPAASMLNPTHDLVTNPADERYYAWAILNGLPDPCIKVDTAALRDGSLEEIYYLTDHHWRTRTAVKAYDTVLASFGKTSQDIVSGYRTVFQGPFFGSQARASLCTIQGDAIEDYVTAFDTSKITVTENGEQKNLDFLDRSAFDSSYSYNNETPFDNAYARIFHTNHGLIEIKNEIAPEGSLLIIGDSYSQCLERLFAGSYRTVYAIDPRTYDGVISDFISEHDIDDALIMLSTATLK